MKCMLEEDINQCKYYNKNSKECTSGQKCTFQEIETPKKEYVRKERWYEQYYRKK